MTLTPLHLRILLHCYALAEPYPHHGCSTEYEEQLIDEGLIDCFGFNSTKRQLTPRGKAHIQQLLSLPLPQQAWVGADGAVIQM